MQNAQNKTHYKDYLKLDKLLTAQQPYSSINGKPSHDEMLFIITHQAYELWFKQILHELYRVVGRLGKEFVSETDLSKVCSSLTRIEKIQQTLIGQLDVLETMTPMDFLEFRDLLVPASGFQSAQFREIEILLGLKLSGRDKNHNELIIGQLLAEDRNRLIQQEKELLLPDVLESWLERLPFTENERFIFWQEYKVAVFEMISKESLDLESSQLLDEETKLVQLKKLQSDRERFEALFNEEKYNELKKEKLVSLSHKAYLNALFIFLYREEGALVLPFQLLTSLTNIDENFSRWRYRHALMVKRMLGNKMGTGGSSGHTYLKQTVKNNRVFQDLISLPSYLIPSSSLPKLPQPIRTHMNLGDSRLSF